jgi:hypothetical protein
MQKLQVMLRSVTYSASNFIRSGPAVKEAKLEGDGMCCKQRMRRLSNGVWKQL